MSYSPPKENQPENVEVNSYGYLVFSQIVNPPNEAAYSLRKTYGGYSLEEAESKFTAEVARIEKEGNR